MAKTVVGLFDNINDADAVIRELLDAGARREHISVVRTGSDIHARDYGSSFSGTTASGAAVGGSATHFSGLMSDAKSVTLPGIGVAHVAGPLTRSISGTGTTSGRHILLDELTERGVSSEDAQFYAEGVRRGSTLVLLRVEDEDVEDVADIMHNHGAVDLHGRMTNWRQSGWKGFDSAATPYTTDQFTKERELYRATPRTATTAGRTPATAREGEVAIPVVEEQMQVGKRRVEHGGVRIVQEVKERPVEETIRLREEHVRVTRRPVDRAVNPDRLDDMKDRTIELTETAEEAVVGKTARVKEEVVVRKETDVHDEKIRDTVRSTDVRVENVQKKR